MATRYYFPATGAAAVTSTYWAGWEKTSEADNLKMITPRSNYGSAAKACTENVSTDPYDILNRQYVSDPIGVHDFTGCAWKAQILCMEDAAKMNALLQIAIRIVSNDGNTIRFELDDAMGGTEFDSGDHVNRAINGTSSANSSQNGDRIVVEIGVNTTNTKADVYTAEMMFGSATAVDLPENETETFAYYPWVEFSHDIAPYVPPADGVFKPQIIGPF